MKWKNRLLTNFFLRNAMADIWGRSEYSGTRGNFTPYFQYRIGTFQKDEYLYFSKEPYIIQYKNEIFNKLCGYSGYDVIKYLEFHYSAFPDSREFLRFLEYEMAERVKTTPSKSRLARYQVAQNWVSEKAQERKVQQQIQLKHDIHNEVQAGVESIVQAHPIPSSRELEEQVEAITRRLTEKVETLLDETEKGIRNITGSFVTGNIQLNNRTHKDKLVQLFILLQGIQSPSRKKGGDGAPLFGKFANIDVASILHLHFDAFKDTKIGTVHTEVGKQAVRIKDHLPTNSSKLQDALQEFFYE